MLESIGSPADLKKLKPEQLSELAAEVRARMLEVVSASGGHLASSLGSVELIIALHYCLDTPRDKIVFDVGHQSYCHKILTGRNERFASLRQERGISGFPSREESPYDVFSCGHSSNAVSLALGLAAAAGSDKVVAVIGDGSLSGGLCFEGLNNAGHLKKDLLVVLNTNELSIAPNVGALSTYLNKLISLPVYNRFRSSLDSFLESRVPKGRQLKKLAGKFEEGLKGLFIPGMLFEELGFRYFGPLDGHDLNVLVPTLRNILAIKGPRLLHVITTKGKGYAPAEKEPVRFHGTGPFDLASGQPRQPAAGSRPSYTQVFSRTLCDLANSNEKIVAITAAMPEGTGLDAFRDAFPRRFYDVGIAEAHALCFASGLSVAGLRPVVAVYSTFLQRALDQVIEDVCLQEQPVVIALDRAGLVGEDGVTHQGVFDIACLRPVPRLVLMAPMDATELRMMLAYALDKDSSLKHPAVIRYPKAACPQERECPRPAIECGVPQVLRQGKDFVMFALGSMVYPAWEALDMLAGQGLQGTLVNCRFAKPLDSRALGRIVSGAAAGAPLFSAEEGVISGGFGSGLAETLGWPVTAIGLPDEFIGHCRRQALLERFGLTGSGIAATIKKRIGSHG